MNFFPKNQKYRTEVYTKTVIAPIILLLFSLFTLIFFNPLAQPESANILGLTKKVTMTIEKTSFVGGANIFLNTKSWGCDSINYFGSYQGRKLETRACVDQKFDGKYVDVGDTIEVLVAPYGQWAYSTARGTLNPVSSIFGLLMAVPLPIYSVLVSLRLFYIGYSSNWVHTRKKNKKS